MDRTNCGPRFPLNLSHVSNVHRVTRLYERIPTGKWVATEGFTRSLVSSAQAPIGWWVITDVSRLLVSGRGVFRGRTGLVSSPSCGPQDGLEPSARVAAEGWVWKRGGGCMRLAEWQFVRSIRKTNDFVSADVIFTERNVLHAFALVRASPVRRVVL